MNFVPFWPKWMKNTIPVKNRNGKPPKPPPFHLGENSKPSWIVLGVSVNSGQNARFDWHEVWTKKKKILKPKQIYAHKKKADDETIMHGKLLMRKLRVKNEVQVLLGTSTGLGWG